MIYIAGSLFSEAEIKQRKEEAAYLRLKLEEIGSKKEVFNPIENPFNDKSTKPKAIDIFKGDYEAMRKSDYLLFNLDNPLDAGVFLELGQMLEHEKNIYPVVSDIRMPTAGDYQGKYVPFGMNQYVVGALDYHGIEIFTSSQDAIDAMIKDIQKNKKR